jgi:hypothetical protein
MLEISEIKHEIRDFALRSSINEIESITMKMRMFLDLSGSSSFLKEQQAIYSIELQVLEDYLLNI